MPTAVQASRTSSTAPTAVCKYDKSQILEIDEGPERDVINFPRLKRPEHPGKVRMGVFPEEWFQFFYPKTGVTGPYLFGTGLLTYLYSKEIMVMDHEFFCGITLIIMFTYAHKKFGKQIAAYCDSEYEKELTLAQESHNSEVEAMKEVIENEARAQEETKCQALIFEAKKENIGLQLETEYRRRQMQAYSEVKKRLDYHLEVINIQRRLQQKHMVDWIVNNVQKSISGQQEKDMLSKCISDLKGLAAKA